MEKEDIVYPTDTIHNSEIIKGEKTIWFEVILRFSARHSKALTLKPLFSHTTFTHTGAAKIHGEPQRHKKKELGSSDFYLFPKLF